VPVGADDKLAKVTIYAVFVGCARKKQRLGRKGHNTYFMNNNIPLVPSKWQTSVPEP
jgi:hypothetical protein